MTGPTDAPARPADGRPDADPAFVPPEPRQRWRLTFGRDRPKPDEVPTGREYIGRWEASLLASELPVLLLASGRPRVALGAPLPLGCSAEGELVEFWLTAVRPAWQVREGIGGTLPDGHRTIDLESVWLGAPALSGQVAAADYAVGVLMSGGSIDHVAEAARRLLARAQVPRERQKGGEARTYDLRPLLVSLDVDGQGATGTRLRMRTRIHPELGTGRPDEVVAALSTELGAELAIEGIVRERLLLADELDGV